MDMRQLRYFLAIAKERQITRAARSLNMEQPPLSRQLHIMEQDLGVKLFDRVGRHLTLTQAGYVLEQRARSLLHQLDETLIEIKEIDQGLRGVLAIGSAFSCISLLPPKISAFRAKYPQVKIQILEGDHFILDEYMKSNAIGLGITRLPFEADNGSEDYVILPLPPDPFVLVIPRRWDLGQIQRSIRIGDLADMPLLALKSDKTKRLHEKIVNECRRFLFEPNIVCECSSVAIIISLVVAGIGATILPKSVMSSFPIDEIDMLDISDTSFLSEVGVVWLRDRYLSQHARHFINILQTH